MATLPPTNRDPGAPAGQPSPPEPARPGARRPSPGEAASGLADPPHRRVARWLRERRAENDLVAEEFSRVNLGRLRVGVMVLVPVNLLHILLFLAAPDAAQQHPRWRGLIIATHAVMMGSMILLGAGAHRALRDEHPGRLGAALSVVGAASVLLFGSALATIDQWVTPSITPIVITGIAIGLVFLLRPTTSISLYGAIGLFSFGSLGLTQHSEALLLSNRVNVLTATSIGCFLSVVMWRTNTTNTLLRRALQESHAQLEQKRKELSVLNQELEARIDQKASELVARATQVQVLAAQLQQRVQDRSQELARALSAVQSKDQQPISVNRVLGGRVRLRSLLGAGGMGMVFVGDDLATGESVAVKVVQSNTTISATMLQRFLRETRAAARVEHPAVARTLHVDVSEDGVLFQVQELVDGTALSSIVAAIAPLTPGEVARFGSVLADALRAAHASGVVHRDIKPGNIMLTGASPGMKLLDFGIAKLSDADDASVSATHEILGTPEYMAPEQILTPGLIDDRADVYSLGLILYRLLAGHGPFQAKTVGEFFNAQVVAIPSDLPPHIPPPLATIVRRCLMKDPRVRPSAFEVAAVLRELADELGVGPLEECSLRWLQQRVSPPPSVPADLTL